MSIFSSIFASPGVNDFAKALAQDVAKRYPVMLDQDAAKRPSVNRMTRIIEDLCNKAVEFQATHRLGWMGKAKLANAFRWELTSMGYQKDFVELATEAVIVHVSRKLPADKQ